MIGRRIAAMPKSLVLAEKPSVAKDLAAVLNCRQRSDGFFSGERHIVTWALGHLVTLAEPEEYGDQYKSWDMATLPMLPEKMQLVIIKESSKQFRIIQSLTRREDVSEIIIATDSGREGELVARWILLKAGCRKPARRLWISSQTTKAIQEGFANLKPAREYDALFRSAQARAEADWLVGLNVTRALTCKFNAQLSAGRVQTPTLALIVQREEEIKRFVPQPYWSVRLELDGYTAVWRNSKGESRLFDKTAAEGIATAVRGQTATLSEVRRTYKQQPPPPAYDLTELQRDANRRYAYSAKDTLALAQSLYEHHKLITYPRTDSRFISDDMIPTLSERLKSVSSGPYTETARSLLRNTPLQTRFLVDNARVSDHHAIIPTEQPLVLSRLSPQERNIYDLIVRRFLAVLSPGFEYEETHVVLKVGKDFFHTRGQIVKAMGWKSVYGSMGTSEDSDGEEQSDQQLPQLKQGDSARVRGCHVISGQTKPPARFTEATLLSAMENPGQTISDHTLRDVIRKTSGLGTPATRAEIIERLFSAFYVERRGKEIAPTSKGAQLISLVPEELKSAELTARWEQQLALISKNQAKDSEFITEMRAFASRLVRDVDRSTAKYVHDNLSREKCPDCGKFLLDVMGKRGRMLICSDRTCGFRKSLAQQSNARCPNCHKKLEIRGEDENRFFACACGFREKVKAFEKRAAAAGAGKSELQRFMNNQEDGIRNNALAEQLAKLKIDGEG